MKSIQFSHPGTPSEVLTCVESERPKPGQGEVIVRMLASPINPSDLMFVRGQYTIPTSSPGFPGFEGVGVVDESGGGLRGRLMAGRRVVVLNRTGGNWAEYAVVRSDSVIPVSRGLSDEQAATFFVNPATAWIMSQEVLCVPRGEWLVQTAAASSVGQMIVRLGKKQGFRTFSIVRRAEQAALLQRLGADRVVVFDGARDSPEMLRQAVRDALGVAGIRFAIDAVGGATGSAVAQFLGPGGHLLVYGTLSGSPLEISSRALMTVGSRIEGFWLGQYMSRATLWFRLRLVRRLTGLIQGGVLNSQIRQSFPLQEIGQAAAAAEQLQDSGKILLRMSSNCGRSGTELTSAIPEDCRKATG